MWPGDVNNNGIVNGVDFLYVSTAIGAQGEERTNPTDDWVEQDLPTPWSQNFSNGLNYAYADTDGNGEIDEDDLEVIEENFGLTHGTLTPDNYSNGSGGTTPQVILELQSSDIKYGDEVEVKILMGDSNNPFVDFYGATMKMSYTEDLTDNDEEWEFDFEDNNWLDPSNSLNLEPLIINDENSATAEIAFARNNQTPISGFGEVGSFFIIIEDYVVGRAEKDTFNIVIDSILVVNETFAPTMTIPDTLSFEVTRATSSTSAHKSNENISIFPNPASYSTTIQFHENMEIELVELTNTLGKHIPINATYPNRGEILVRWQSTLPKGLYFLSLRSANTMKSLHLQIQ